jgi:hypothetical protein
MVRRSLCGHDILETDPIFDNLRARLIHISERSPRIGKRPRHEIRSPQKKKGQPLSQDGWLFLFVPTAAETVSVLKEAG